MQFATNDAPFTLCDVQCAKIASIFIFFIIELQVPRSSRQRECMTYAATSSHIYLSTTLPDNHQVRLTPVTSPVYSYSGSGLGVCSHEVITNVDGMPFVASRGA